MRSLGGCDGVNPMVVAALEAPGFRKAVLHETDKIKQNLEDIYEDSDRVLVNNLLSETKSVFRKVSDSSKSYRRRSDLLGKLNDQWFQLWEKFRDDPSKFELIKFINSITDYTLAYSKLFIGVSLVNESYQYNQEKELNNIVYGLSLISEVIEVFYGFLRISELQNILSEIKKLYSPNSQSREIYSYFETSADINILLTQFKALCEFIISNLEKRIDPQNIEVKEWLANLPVSSDDWLEEDPEKKSSFEQGLKQASVGQVRRRSFMDLEFED